MSRLANTVLAFILLKQSHSAPNTATKPLAYSCGPSTSNIHCIAHYDAVLPYPFYRSAFSGPQDEAAVKLLTFGQTQVNGSTFSGVQKADFLVFDNKTGLEILGSSPSLEFIFATPATHLYEAPVFVPARNKIYFSALGPPGNLPQLVINLNATPPTLSNYTPNVPIYAPGGGTNYKGKILFLATGSNGTGTGINGTGSYTYRPGLILLDPNTGDQEYLLNNYFGYYFNGLNDVAVDQHGDIWFTDSGYSWFTGLSDTPPQLPFATYRFRPSTGAVSVVETSLLQPNGIAFSPSGTTLYIGDSGSDSGPITGPIAQGANYSNTGARFVYAYDVNPAPPGSYITNKRAIYSAIEWAPDGLKVSAEGYVVTATGKGLDVLDPWGTLLVRAQTNFTVQNFVWAGKDLKTVWAIGLGGVVRIEWNITGPVMR